MYYATAVPTAVRNRVTMSVAPPLGNNRSKRSPTFKPSSTCLLLISSGLTWGSGTTSLFLISPGLWLMLALVVQVLLYVHRNRRLIRDGSPGRPPRLSHSSWAQMVLHLKPPLSRFPVYNHSGLTWTQWPSSAGKIPQASLYLCDVTNIIPTNKHVTLGITSSGLYTNVTCTTQNTGLQNSVIFFIYCGFFINPQETKLTKLTPYTKTGIKKKTKKQKKS